MTQKDKILAIAAKEVGYRQAANGSNKYGQWYGMDKVAWCAIFLSWCAVRAGINADIIPAFSYVPHGVTFFKQQGRFKAAKGYTPQPGDIVFYDFNGNGTADHVGLVESYGNGKITAIEGNTSAASQTNGGAVERKQRKAPLVLGYGVPEYEDMEEEDMGKVFNNLAEVPSYGKPTVEKLIRAGALKGDETGLNLNETMLRIFVVLDRMGKL